MSRSPARRLYLEGDLVAERPGCRLVLKGIDGTPTVFFPGWSALFSALRRDRQLIGLVRRLPVTAGLQVSVRVVVGDRPVLLFERFGHRLEARVEWRGLFGGYRLPPPKAL
ncbi:MAG: hypothetical protein ACFB21_13755 [Opitutales bacterium]